VSLRQKLLLLFSLTVAAAVAAVAWTVLLRIRHVFELRDQTRRSFSSASSSASSSIARRSWLPL